MEFIDYDRLMQANASQVFSERGPARRPDAIRELYAADAVVIEPEGVSEGPAAISNAVTDLLAKLPPTFAFTSIGPAIGHHGIGRLLWKAGPPNGMPAVTAWTSRTSKMVAFKRILESGKTRLHLSGELRSSDIEEVRVEIEKICLELFWTSRKSALSTLVAPTSANGCFRKDHERELQARFAAQET